MQRHCCRVAKPGWYPYEAVPPRRTPHVRRSVIPDLCTAEDGNAHTLPASAGGCARICSGKAVFSLGLATRMRAQQVFQLDAAGVLGLTSASAVSQCVLSGHRRAGINSVIVRGRPSGGQSSGRRRLAVRRAEPGSTALPTTARGHHCATSPPRVTLYKRSAPFNLIRRCGVFCSTPGTCLAALGLQRDSAALPPHLGSSCAAAWTRTSRGRHTHRDDVLFCKLRASHRQRISSQPQLRVHEVASSQCAAWFITHAICSLSLGFGLDFLL